MAISRIFQLTHSLSPSCQSTVLSLATNSSLAQCLDFTALLPVFTSNSSVIAPLDTWLADTCSMSPCSNTTLASTAQTLITGCQSDLSNAGLTNSTIEDIFGLYPLAREIACLKTSDPFNATNATIPIASGGYNATNGTFCATSLLTELSSYLGANLTIPYVLTVALGANSTALQTLEMIPPTALCSECIFAALDLVEQEYPSIGNYSVASNYTLNQYLEGTCAADGYNITTNGTLPANITEVADNSTYPYTIVVGNTTILPGNATVAPPSFSSVPTNISIPTNSPTTAATISASGSPERRNVAAVKGRWIGEH